MAIGLSQNGTTHYRSSGPTEEMLVATLKGVITLRREGAKKWGVARRSLEEHHIGSLAIDTSTGLTLAGVHGGTVYVSEDFGKRWELREKGIKHRDVFCVNFQKRGDQYRIYAGTEPAHLYVSDDLGKSWQELPTLRSVSSVPRWMFPSPGHEAHVKNVTFHPFNHETLFASIEQGGLLVSRDEGKSWEDFQGFDDDVHRLLIRTSDPDCFFISGGGSICRSRDAGKTWKDLMDPSLKLGYPDPLLMHPQREELLFMAGAGTPPPQWPKVHTADSKIARSRDGGESWEILQRGLPQHIHGNIEAMSMDTWDGLFSLFAATTDGDVFYSEDEGENWTTIAEALPPISKGNHYALLR